MVVRLVASWCGGPTSTRGTPADHRHRYGDRCRADFAGHGRGGTSRASLAAAPARRVRRGPRPHRRPRCAGGGHESLRRHERPRRKEHQRDSGAGRSGRRARRKAGRHDTDDIAAERNATATGPRSAGDGLAPDVYRKQATRQCRWLRQGRGAQGRAGHGPFHNTAEIPMTQRPATLRRTGEARCRRCLRAQGEHMSHRRLPDTSTVVAPRETRLTAPLRQARRPVASFVQQRGHPRCGTRRRRTSPLNRHHNSRRLSEASSCCVTRAGPRPAG
jgi:hypothetical protein